MADQAAPSPSSSVLPPLVGREREQATLRDALDAALAGRGSLVLIGGDAGIGKTALAEALLAEARARGALVLVGRCYDLAETPPYGPWRDLFARGPRDAGLPTLPAAVLPPDRGGDALGSQAALQARAVAYLAALAARQPLVVLLEDLHWADPASLDLLRVFGRDLTDLPLLLLVTYRADEPDRRHRLYALLPALVREAHAGRVDLRPLDDGTVRALVDRRYALGAAEAGRLVAHLQVRAEGNPLYLGEILRAHAEGGALRRGDAGWALGDLDRTPVPALLRQVIAARVGRLGEEASRLLAVAAVLGQETTLDLWARVAAVEPGRLLEEAERAIEAQFLAVSADGAGIQFTHALVRAALYEGVGALRRRTWHRRAAEVLSVEPHPDPDLVAHHFRQAGDARAADWLVRAGERAQRDYAWLTAAARYEAALALPGAGGDPGARGWLLVRLARLLRFSDAGRGLAHLDDAVRVAAEVGDPALHACARYFRGDLRMYLGELGHAVAEMGTALAAAEALAPPDRARLRSADDALGIASDSYAGTLALYLAWLGRYAESSALAERVIPAAEHAPGTRVVRGLGEANAYRALALAHTDRGRPEQARRAFGQAREAYEAVGHYLMVASVIVDELERVVLRYQADRPAARRQLAGESDRVRARAGGVREDLPPRLAQLGLALLEGHWSEIRPVAEPAVAGLGATSRGYVWRIAGVLGPLAREQGDRELAWAMVRTVLPDGPATPPGDIDFGHALTLRRLAAALALDAGDLPAARAWLEGHDHWLAWSGGVAGRSEGDLLWARYHRAAGDAGAARRHAERALAHATEPRQPLALLAARRTLGEVHTTAGRYPAAAADLAVALALAAACAAPYERALTLLALAELRGAEGRRDDALAHLDEARAICAPLGAVRALDRADTLARCLNAPATAVPSAGSAPPFGLSMREVEVLRLVAEGLPNARVAERLFLSPKTVARHLDAIYGKLGVDNRTAAARRAADHGLL